GEVIKSIRSKVPALDGTFRDLGAVQGPVGYVRASDSAFSNLASGNRAVSQGEVIKSIRSKVFTLDGSFGDL
ncbi:hypothetical protein QM646_26995, partial [Rhodococcus erythropolis]|nr:hypothetical protein [Rhodococcus erythropolis]